MRFTTEREVGGVTVQFVWHGGAYIDVGIAGDPFHASEVINVWDYRDDRPRIERTAEAFDAKVDDWIANYDGLERDMENW
jgi:hypothetical protein